MFLFKMISACMNIYLPYDLTCTFFKLLTLGYSSITLISSVLLSKSITASSNVFVEMRKMSYPPLKIKIAIIRPIIESKRFRFHKAPIKLIRTDEDIRQSNNFSFASDLMMGEPVLLLTFFKYKAINNETDKEMIKNKKIKGELYIILECPVEKAKMLLNDWITILYTVKKMNNEKNKLIIFSIL